MGASRRLREATHHTLHQTDNDLASQQDATDYAYRKRLHEMKKAIDELKWQKEQVRHISQRKLIHKLQACVHDVVTLDMKVCICHFVKYQKFQKQWFSPPTL